MLLSDVGPLQSDLVGVRRAVPIERALEAENLVLRQQINILRRTAPKRPSFGSIDELLQRDPNALIVGQGRANSTCGAGRWPNSTEPILGGTRCWRTSMSGTRDNRP